MSHLTGDEHVLTADDALFDLVLDGFAQFYFVLVAEGRIQVTVTGSNGSLCSSLAHRSRNLQMNEES